MGPLDDFFGRLALILKQEPRFREEAYLFVMAGLGRAARLLPAPRHLTGRELLEGLRLEAEEQFGPMAGEVFRHWGIKNSLDFGRIVFKMVDQGILSKAEQDRLEDFDDPAFFERLFDDRAAYRLIETNDSGKKTARTPNPVKLKVKGSSDG
jgi:uncharacterized repeat protein (TIGR04138 family)